MKSKVFSLFYIVIPIAVASLWFFLDGTREIEGLAYNAYSKVDSEIFAEVPSGNFRIANNNYFVNAFYISRTEVTVKDYFKITKKNPTSYNSNSDFPVTNVTWNDAALYCNLLSESQKLKPVYEIDGKGNVIGYDLSKNGYRLPTKNEWYFAAIGAGIRDDDKTNDVDYIDKVAWFYYNSNHEPHPVAKKHPNAIGIYDMRGNVSEWCNDDAWDWSDISALNIKKDFCYDSRKQNPQKAICGGFYDNSAKKLDFLSCQDLCVQNGSSDCYGFRIVKPKK